MASRSQRPTLLALAIILCCLQQLAIHAAASGDRREVAGAGDAAKAQRACTYTVEIKTSCSSPARSPDAVSLSFGDTYKNEVYAATVTPARGFERCAKDTFRVSGPCGYGVCYLYLRRSGRVGWTPEWVRVYEPTSATPSTFYFGDPLANGVWYGTDRCLRRTGAVADDAAAAAAAARPMLQKQSTTGGAHAAVM